MHDGSVPATFDDFLTHYAHFVRWCINRISKGQTRPDDLPDLTQKVYLRVWEKDFLSRCRVLIAERGVGKFSTYLYMLVRSVLVNEYRANSRNPLNAAFSLLDARDVTWGESDTASRSPVVATGTISEHGPALQGRFVDDAFEDRAIFDVQLARFANFIATTQEVSQLDTTLSQTLILLLEGCTTSDIQQRLGVTRSRVVRARRVLRETLPRFVAR